MVRRRPVIGISAAIASARWAIWEDIDINLSQRTYSERVDQAGGLPLLLPTSDVGTADPDSVLDLIDAVVLTGGADLDPAIYGAGPDPHTTGVHRGRDEFELAIARAAIDRDMPLLAICRGFEVLNVALGGTLEQHLADAEVHMHTPGRFSDHAVRLEPGSLAARAAGTERLTVRSHHHQGAGRLGDGLVATGWSEPGHVTEAIELPGRRWVLGILWHTEEEETSRVVASFVEASSSFAVRRSGEVLA